MWFKKKTKEPSIEEKVKVNVVFIMVEEVCLNPSLTTLIFDDKNNFLAFAHKRGLDEIEIICDKKGLQYLMLADLNVVLRNGKDKRTGTG
jgi:ABC-type cobalamin transport system ATPase subunit